MKKKIDPQRHFTDAVNAFDEWDSFDYDLQQQIKELARIDYDKNPQLWKNNVAYGYLYHIEKLLTEKYQGSGSEIENIRELKTLLNKFDNLKTCLLTLQVATAAYRAGLIPELVQAGVSLKRSQSEKGSKRRTRNGITPAERSERDQKIFQHFKKTRLKPSGFAEKHAAKFGLKPRSVRLILKKAVGSQPG